MHKTLVSLGVLSVSLLVSWAPSADRLVFAPTTEANLERTITMSADLTLESIETSMNGESDTDRPEIAMDVSWTRTLAVIDRFEVLRAGAPAKFTRRFKTAAEEGEYELAIGEGREQGRPVGSSALEGTTVEFEWNPAEGAYDKAFEETGPSELLDGLTEDLDLRVLLPDGEVQADDTWQVAPDEFVAILRPGGVLGIEIESEATERRMEAVAFGVEPALATNPERLVGAVASGSEVTAKYAGTREVEGTRLATVRFEFNVSTTHDTADFMKELVEGFEAAEIEIVHGSYELFLEGDAELQWDLEAGHMHAFDLKARTTLSVSRVAEAVLAGNEMELSTDLTFAGDLTYASTNE